MKKSIYRMLSLNRCFPTIAIIILRFSKECYDT